MTSPNNSWIFYDGPPFASGTPHMGHLLAGIIKDTVVRYRCGKKARNNRFGWDTHGLPIESKANDNLGVTCRQDVLDMGIGKYNAECRKLVLSCVPEWKIVTEKMARDIDMDNPYMTMDLDFMNSVWWVFSELYKKNLVYHGVKIMAYSPGMQCPLSNSEAALNYRDVNDPSLTLMIPIKFQGLNCHILVWTTTPWTLSCNLLLCVNPTSEYALFELDDRRRVIALKHYFNGKHNVLTTFPGSDLVGLMYEPLFGFYADDYNNAFMIVSDPMVSNETGTGVVHIAPGFGQDDYNVAVKIGLISSTILPPCPLDDKCMFTSPVADDPLFGHKFVKECDKDVIAFLKQKGYVFQVGSIKHSYPYCYRTDKPLIYRTYPAWFIEVEKHKDSIVKNAMSVNWHPVEVKNRFMGQMDTVVDWCVSRNRFWGTPLPIWTNAEGEIIVIESSYQLSQMCQKPITDIHLEHVIDIELPSPTGKSNLKHVGLVLDCWFESGSMPFAQHGYPFKATNPNVIDDIFPADFIAEGVDQTRGWFYSLLVISTLLFDKSPFKNVIVNGHILGNDGQKMSKKTKNYSDPKVLLEEYTSDVVRLALLSSPAVKAQSYKLDLKKLYEIKAGFSMMMNNCLAFWKQSLEIYVHNNGPFTFQKYTANTNPNDVDDLLDIWIMQYTNQFITSMRKQLDEYQLIHLIDDVNNMIDKMSRWYIKLKKSDLKGESGKNTHYKSLNAMTTCLYHISLILTPITPHMADKIFATIKDVIEINERPDGYDLIDIPVTFDMIDTMEVFIDTIELGRKIREKHKRSHKMPVKSINIVVDGPDKIMCLKQLEHCLIDELNTLDITYSMDFSQQVKYRFVPDKAIIRMRYSEYKMKNFCDLDDPNVMDLNTKGYNSVKYMIDDNKYQFVKVDKDCYVMYVDVIGKKDNNMASSNVILHMDMTYTDDMNELYVINCICRSINAKRKECNLKPIDNVDYKFTGNEIVENLLAKHDVLILSKLNRSIEKIEDQNHNFNYEYDIDLNELMNGIKFKIHFLYKF